METDFIVTDIKRVIMVGKDEYPEQITTFKHDLQSNELIFNFSGHSTVYFNGKELDNASGTVRFLPKGQVTQYEVFRHERGECIDIFFNTDRPLSDVAFVINAVDNEKLSSLFKRIFAVCVNMAVLRVFQSLLRALRTLLSQDMHPARCPLHWVWRGQEPCKNRIIMLWR